MTYEVEAHLKEDDPFPIKVLPLLSPFEEVFRDPRDGKTYHGYLVNVRLFTDEMWRAAYEDMKGRFPDAPPTLEEFRDAIEKQGGMPIRAHRVEFVTDHNPMRWLSLLDDDEGWDEDDDCCEDDLDYEEEF